MKKAALLYPLLFTRYLPFALAFLFLLISARIVAQTELWGLTNFGAAGYGSIIKLNTDGSGFANFVFETQGVNPQADLLEWGGKFYGMTPLGGSNGYGVLFEYDHAAGGSGAYTVKHNFDNTNGGQPNGSLIASGGKFYGMTLTGGSHGHGVIFEYELAGGGLGIYTVKHNFDNTNGGYPYGSLIEWGGKFYGMTSQGGSDGLGVLFEYDPAGAGIYTVKHFFDSNGGYYPNGSLVVSNGKFYGMTLRGGVSNGGVLFEYDPAGAGIYTVKHFFDSNGGYYPYGSLIVSNGKFYGMTSEGGSNAGVLFEYAPATGGNGTYMVKHHFDYTSGAVPRGSLIESDGKFYGMTNAGGIGGDGVIFEYDPAAGGSGTYTVKHLFDNIEGRSPYGSLTVSGGILYGMASFGGSKGGGVLFAYDPAGAGTYAVKHHFDFINGGNPAGSLIASSGKFYGMTSEGGSSDLGVLFAYDPAGVGIYTVEHHFDGTNGRNPRSKLMEYGGKFYGMTPYGGIHDSGVLFEYDPAGVGTYTVKHHFFYTHGRTPYGSLIESGGKFYGLTFSGGNNDLGVIFEYDPAGAGIYTIKYHFNSFNGGGPQGSLIESGGKFYGMTYGGVIFNDGVLFEYDPASGGSGTYSVKHYFNKPVDGSFSSGSLIESDGKFYGMTGIGGSGDGGVLFEYDPNGSGSGTFSVKHHFEYANGSNPHGSLIESDGKFYGMATAGGSSEGGVLFEYDPNGGGSGTYTVLRHFEYADGINPLGDLIAVTLVNTTILAGSPVFEMKVSPNPSGDKVAVEIFSEKARSGNLAIIDLQGRQIAELAKDRVFQGQERIVWSAAELPAGVYFLRMRTDTGVYTAKFVKQ
ncbi:MAG: choice-of-anchor tandem repeat GloVer-containing protein [Saprospiraceae bacterium]